MLGKNTVLFSPAIFTHHRLLRKVLAGAGGRPSLLVVQHQKVKICSLIFNGTDGRAYQPHDVEP
jgi:hypothetical protein